MSPELQLLLWVAASLAIGLTAMAYVHRIGGGWRRQALAESDLGGTVAEVALFLYYIGLPFLALISGALSVDLLGLGTIGVENAPTLAGFTALDWMRSGMAAGLAAGFVLIVLWQAGRTSGSTDQSHRLGLPLTMRDAAYAEMHWAFYRAPFVLLLEDAHWGAAAGFAFVFAEQVTLRLLQQSSAYESRPQTLTLVCCALTSGLLYVVSRNLWVMIVTHMAIRWASGRLLSQTAHATTART